MDSQYIFAFEYLESLKCKPTRTHSFKSYDAACQFRGMGRKVWKTIAANFSPLFNRTSWVFVCLLGMASRQVFDENHLCTFKSSQKSIKPLHHCILVRNSSEAATLLGAKSMVGNSLGPVTQSFNFQGEKLKLQAGRLWSQSRLDMRNTSVEIPCTV